MHLVNHSTGNLSLVSTVFLALSSCGLALTFLSFFFFSHFLSNFLLEFLMLLILICTAMCLFLSLTHTLKGRPVQKPLRHLVKLKGYPKSSFLQRPLFSELHCVPKCHFTPCLNQENEGLQKLYLLSAYFK